jgi:hypothetical protein
MMKFHRMLVRVKSINRDSIIFVIPHLHCKKIKVFKKDLPDYILENAKIDFRCFVKSNIFELGFCPILLKDWELPI